MNVSGPFILRPVGTTLFMAAILLSGIVAYSLLPLSTLPQVDYPTIQVQTFYPGASPEVMTSSVTAPLERQLGQMPGLSQMTSASSAGASIITLQFGLDLTLDVAEQVRGALDELANTRGLTTIFVSTDPATDTRASVARGAALERPHLAVWGGDRAPASAPGLDRDHRGSLYSCASPSSRARASDGMRSSTSWPPAASR